MFEFQFDMSALERAAQQVGGALDQVPYAISLALNESVKVARKHEVDDVWPQHVEIRNRGFLGAALRTEFATKRNLRVTVYDRLGRGHLTLHESGGMKRAKGRLAIPSQQVRRTSRGVSTRQRPAALANSFRKGDVIYQRAGPRGRKLKLMYVLKTSAQVRAEVPFTAEFDAVMRREMQARFGAAVRKFYESK